LLSELHLHLFVARLVLADAVTCDEVATDVGQLWVLLPCLLDKPDTHIIEGAFKYLWII